MTLKEKCAALEQRVGRLQEIGLALSTEDDINVIFELIMEEAKNITNADGRTLYMISDDAKTMKFEILCTDSMNFYQGGTSGVEITIPPMQLFDDKGKPNHSSIVTYSANTGKTVKTIENDTNRDNFMSAEKALEYGMIDQIVSTR